MTAFEIQNENRNPGSALRNEAANYLSGLYGNGRTEILIAGKKVDGVFERDDFGSRETIILEAKDYARPLHRDDLKAIWSDYETVLDEVRPAKLLVISRHGLAPGAQAYLDTRPPMRHRTIWELEDEVLGLRPHTQAMAAAFEEGGLSRFYIEARAAEVAYDADMAESEGEVVGLIDEVVAWLATEDPTPLAILGGYGAGKSSFAKRLVTQQAAQALTDPSARRPILIKLGGLSRYSDLEGFLGAMLTSQHNVRGYNFTRFLDFNSKGRFLNLAPLRTAMMQARVPELALALQLLEPHGVLASEDTVRQALEPMIAGVLIERTLGHVRELPQNDRLSVDGEEGERMRALATAGVKEIAAGRTGRVVSMNWLGLLEGAWAASQAHGVVLKTHAPQQASGYPPLELPLDVVLSTIPVASRPRIQGFLHKLSDLRHIIVVARRKALGLTEDLIKTLSSQVWSYSSEGVEDRHAEELNLNLEDRRLRLALDLSRQLIGFPRHLSQHPGGFVLTDDRLDDLVPIEPAAMKDRQVIEWDKDDIDALKFMKVDVLALGMAPRSRPRRSCPTANRGVRPGLRTGSCARCRTPDRSFRSGRSAGATAGPHPGSVGPGPPERRGRG